MSAAPEITWPQEFFKRIHRLAPADSHRVIGALGQFAADPDHPSLNLEKLSGRAKNFWSIRASQSLRVLLVKEGNVYCAVDVGPHDELYERAERSRFVIDPRRSMIRLVTLDEQEDGERPPPPGPPAEVAVERTVHPLDHWSDAELAEVGFDATDVAKLRGCTTDEELLALAIEDDERFEVAIDLVSTTPEAWRAPVFDEAEASEERLRTSIAEFGALAGFSRIFGPDELRRLAAAPIEDWMVFLHPEQEAAVHRRYDGPARIRGAAGTGKTVVALHRAAALVDRFREEEGSDQKVLFTTFIKSLPPVFEHLYERLPNSHPGTVDFLHVDRLASIVCQEDGHRPVTVPRDIDAAFAAAVRHVVTAGSPLEHFTRNYLREEISAVIKGRGIQDLDAYLNVSRIGRRVRFTEPMRRQIWDLHLQFREELDRRGTADFPDVVLAARDLARRRPTATYRAAIIDEAQDLTLVGLQLIRALVTDAGTTKPDSLLIVGDGAQRIYAGGFTLRQAGIDVRGRTTVLRNNYRNTGEILAAAEGVAGAETVEDLGEEYRRAEEVGETSRDGERPRLVICTSDGQMWDRVTAQISDLVEAEGVDFGDIGVFMPTNAGVTSARNALDHRGIPTMGLDRYEGRHTPHVKVGTYFRAKGLEFKAVFLPALNRGDYPRAQQADQPDAEYEEYRSLALGQLFVAMTRARDHLTVLCVGEPSEAIAAARDEFDA